MWPAGSFTAVRRLLSSCDQWAPEPVGSVVAVLGLIASWPVDLSSSAGIESESAALEGGFLTTGPHFSVVF